jgi:hypothetical protein
MNKDSILKFGKYQGRTVEEVWTGRVNAEEADVIRGYLQELLDFFAGFRQDDVMIPASDADYAKCETELGFIVNDAPSFKSYVTSKYIILESDDEHVINPLKTVLKISLTGNFLLKFGKANWVSPDRADDEANEVSNDYSANSKQFLSLQSDPDYIIWCINEVNGFFIVPEDLEELETKLSRFFLKFEITSIKDNLIEYKPIFKEFRQPIPEKTKRANQQKFEANEPPVSNSGSEEGFYHNEDFDDFERASYCQSCQESPCMCSDSEQTGRSYY